MHWASGYVKFDNLAIRAVNLFGAVLLDTFSMHRSATVYEIKCFLLA